MEPPLFPTVSVDRSWGNKIGAVEVDLEAIGDYLRQRGLSDEQITGLTIELTKRDETQTTWNDVHPRIYGRTHFSKSLIELRRPSHQRLDEMNVLVSGRLTGTLIHELEHYIASFDDEMTAAQQEFAIVKAEYHEKLAHGTLLYRELKRDAIFVYVVGAYVLAACVSAPKGPVVALGIMGTEALAGVAALGAHELWRTRHINRKVKLDMYREDPGEVRAFATQHAYDDANLISVADLKNEAEPVTIKGEFPSGLFWQACTRAKEFLATVIRRNADPADNAQ